MLLQYLKKIAKNIYKKFWEVWQETWFYPEHLEKRSIRQALEGVTHDMHGKLLDAGCGSKPYYDLLKDHVEMYIGLEYPPSTTSGTKIAADLYADAMYLPIKSNSVDIVLSTQVLEHLPKPASFFQEAYRVLIPGGKLYLSTNQEWGVHKAPFDFFRFTHLGLKYLCDSAGFSCLRVENRGGFWIMIGQRLSAYLYERWVNRFRKNYKFVFFMMFCLLSPCIALTQLAAFLVDKIDRVEANTIGYFLIAQKPNEVVKS